MFDVSSRDLARLGEFDRQRLVVHDDQPGHRPGEHDVEPAQAVRAGSARRPRSHPARPRPPSRTPGPWPRWPARPTTDARVGVLRSSVRRAPSAGRAQRRPASAAASRPRRSRRSSPRSAQHRPHSAAASVGAVRDSAPAPARTRRGRRQLRRDVRQQPVGHVEHRARHAVAGGQRPHLGLGLAQMRQRGAATSPAPTAWWPGPDRRARSSSRAGSAGPPRGTAWPTGPAPRRRRRGT